MRYLTSFILMLFSVICIAQNCKLEIDDIDPRTKLRVVRTEFEQLERVNNNPFLIKAQAVGEQRFLKIRYYRYNNFEIKPGSEMEFILSDNSTVTLKPFINPGDTVPEQNSFMTVSSMIIFPIEPADFEKLSTYDLVKFKYFIEQGYIYTEVKEKRQTLLRELLQCIK